MALNFQSPIWLNSFVIKKENIKSIITTIRTYMTQKFTNK